MQNGGHLYKKQGQICRNGEYKKCCRANEKKIAASSGVASGHATAPGKFQMAKLMAHLSIRVTLYDLLFTSNCCGRVTSTVLTEKILFYKPSIIIFMDLEQVLIVN